MPNHVKNRITIIGTDEQIKTVVEELSTFYPETPGVIHDGSIRYKYTKGSQHDYGFLDEKTNTFSVRGEEDVIGVPDGYEVDMEPSWTRMPDFNKIVPMPDSLNITADSFVSVMDSDTYHKHDRLLESLDNVKKYVEKQDKDKGEETLKNFLTGVENYLRYGYATWYGWAPANWGTKWNAYSCEKESDNTFTFDTAWSGVPDMVKKMSKLFPDVTLIRMV